MVFDQYHEPAHELSDETRTFARMMASLGEEAEAINLYEQRMSVEKDSDARAIMANAQKEEFKHFGMDLEFLLRKKPVWRAILQGILFQPGDMVDHGNEAEDQNNLAARFGALSTSLPRMHLAAHLCPERDFPALDQAAVLQKVTELTL
jgi:hypothetical protein